MIPNQREYATFGFGQIRIYIYVVILPLFYQLISHYFS